MSVGPLAGKVPQELVLPEKTVPLVDLEAWGQLERMVTLAPVAPRAGLDQRARQDRLVVSALKVHQARSVPLVFRVRMGRTAAMASPGPRAREEHVDLVESPGTMV